MSDDVKKGLGGRLVEPEDNYSEVLEVPPELQAIRDAAIEFAVHGGEPPADLHRLEEWFSNDFDVYENTHSETAAEQFDPAIRVGSGNLSCACDSDLRFHFGLSEDAYVTDALRIDYTRELLEEEWALGGETIVGVGTRSIADSSGQSCLIGYLEETHGQSGVVCIWEGVFSDLAAWEDHLKKIGLRRYNGLAEVPDEIVLAIYSYNNGQRS